MWILKQHSIDEKRGHFWRQGKARPGALIAEKEKQVQRLLTIPG